MRFSVPCRILFGMFLAACISARCAFALELPDPRKALGDPALERMAGVIFSQQFEKQGFSGKAPTILPADAPETIVIKKITTRLAKAIQADHPAMRFQLKVVQDNDVNAFCLPGGFIYVNTGLLEFITANNKGVLDESALAGVLGHEMAHAVLRHSMQHWAQLKAGQSVLEQETFRKVMRAMSREQEAEADRYGALYSLRAGYQFSRLIKLFENMARKTNPNPDAKEDVSNSDHPSPWQRAKQLREYMRQLSQVMGLWDESLNSINTDNFDEARTALEILVVEFPNLATVHNNLGWVNYQIYERSLPEQKRGQQQFSYSYVPSMGVILRGVDPTDKEALENARAAFEQARRLNPEMVEAIEGAGLVALAGQDNVAARELFEAGLKLSPKSSGLQNALAVALERDGKSDAAAAGYTAVLAIDTEHLPAMYNLSGLYQKQGKSEEAKALLEKYLAASAAGFWAKQARERLVALGGTPAVPNQQQQALEVRPEAILADITFGASAEEVIKKLGEPDDRVALESGTEVLRYDEKGVAVFVGASGVHLVVLCEPFTGKVGDATLGMGQDAVVKALGAAPKVKQMEDGRALWCYAARGLALGIRNEHVDMIVLARP